LITITGNGYFIWQVKRIGDLATAARKAKQAGLSWVAIKVTDGPYKFNIDPDTKHDYAPDAVAAFRAAGIAVWGWGYVYGNVPDAEAAAAVDRVKSLGLTGWIIDAEAEYKNKPYQASLYMGALRTRLPGIPLAICSFRYPDVHPEFPWKQFLQADINMPQVYWMQAQNSGIQLKQSYTQFKNRTTIPYIPIGAAFGEAGWIPTTDSIKEFANTSLDLGLNGYGWWEWYDAVKVYSSMWDASVARSNNPGGVSPDNQPTEDLMSYQFNAHGIGVDKRHTLDTTKARPDFIVGSGFDGEQLDLTCSTHIGAASAIGVPFILLVRLNPDWFEGWVGDPEPQKRAPYPGYGPFDLYWRPVLRRQAGNQRHYF
jgi:hypothetical protein